MNKCWYPLLMNVCTQMAIALYVQICGIFVIHFDNFIVKCTGSI